MFVLTFKFLFFTPAFGEFASSAATVGNEIFALPLNRLLMS